VRIPPAFTAFALLLSFLVALPSFGIDMSLPVGAAEWACDAIASHAFS
jgi:hypothetical protein